MKNAKSLVIVWILTAISMWGLAGVWHKLIVASFYENTHGANHQGIGLILVAYLILAGLMCLLHLNLKSTSHSVYKRGVLIGIFIGIAWVFPHQLAMAGAHGEPLAYVFKNALWHIFEQGFGGLVMVYSFKKIN